LGLISRFKERGVIIAHYYKNQKGLNMAKYIELTASNFADTINEGVALVDFWAPWCGPCRMIAPVIEELAADFEGKAKICKVNTDEEQDIAVKYGIRSIPTILFFKNGEMVDTMVGAASKQAFADKINSLL
jgi:thioredoxin 1